MPVINKRISRKALRKFLKIFKRFSEPPTKKQVKETIDKDKADIYNIPRDDYIFELD